MTTSTTLERKLYPAAPAPMSKRRMLEVISHLDPRLGGLSAVVPRLSAELAESYRFDVEMCIFRGPGEQDTASFERNVGHSIWPSSRVAWCRDSALRHNFRSLLDQTDGVHIHGLWETSATVAARLARAAGKPYIISAHGMLEPWALRNKALKKRIYSALLERSNLRGAACLHALTEAEAEDYRRFGCRQPIAVIPNGVDARQTAGAALFLERFPSLVGKKILLFLGRIHFKKGLDLLVSAWAGIAQQYPDAVLVLAGPDSEGSLTTVQKLIGEYGLADSVLFTGMLDEAMKWSALASATSFVLPSYSEGLSVAVLEALSMGVPVIASKQCHIPEVEGRGAGWVISTEIHPLQLALRKVLENSLAVNASIGRQGQALAREYRWQVVAGKMAELYGWIAGGPHPVSFAFEGARA
jgi:glycosyltransferase involved in cell wall biosynthesis